MEKQTKIQQKEPPDRAYQPSGISLTRIQIPLSGRAMEAIRELKRQDMNSYRYLLMEDMLFAAVEGLCREQGESSLYACISEKGAESGAAGKMFQGKTVIFRKPENI